jgi:hypothetical protein
LQVVEFLGIPGSGKSTIVNSLVGSAGGTVGLDTAVKRSISTNGVDRATRIGSRLTGAGTGRLWKALYARSADRFDALGRAISTHPGAIEAIAGSQRARADRDHGQGMVLGWLLDFMARYQLAAEWGGADWLVIDEGFTQRAIGLFAYGFGVEDTTLLRTYLEQIPAPDLLVVVDTPFDICMERLSRRGWSDRLADVDQDGRLRFLDGSTQVVELATERMTTMGIPVVTLDGTASVSSSAGEVASSLRLA